MGYDVNSKVWSWSDFRFWIISKNYKYSVLTLVVKIFTFSNWKFNKCWLILARQLLCKKYQRTSCKRRLTHFKRELVVVVGWLCLKHTATVVWLSGDSCLAWHTRAELQQRHQNWAQPGHHLTGHHNKTIKKPLELECLLMKRWANIIKMIRLTRPMGAKKNLAKKFINKLSICRRLALVQHWSDAMSSKLTIPWNVIEIRIANFKCF